MKMWIITALLSIGVFSCIKVQKLNGVVINAIHLRDVNLTEQDIYNENVFNWTYIHNKLYISDNLHKKIFVLGPQNRVIFELGNIFDTSTQKQNEQQGWEEILGKMQADFSSGKSLNEENENTHLSSTPVSSVRKVNYKFSNLGKIAVDNNGDLYVVHSFIDGASLEGKMEILKFAANGHFLYKIGAEGRDNPPFPKNFRIQSLVADANNGLWVKYIYGEKLLLRYYSNFGKNILFFSEDKLIPLIEGYINQNFEGQKYIIEDIFPVMNSRDVFVVLDLYKEDKSGALRIEKKEILTVDKHYSLRDIFNIPDPQTQIFGISMENHFIGFRYKNEKSYLLEVYNNSGKIIQKSAFSPDVSYYKRVSLHIDAEGTLLGAFLKSRDLLFIAWS